MVPYTLPGVLALIGCWWYLSRKKQGSISHGSPEGPPPTATGLKTPSSEGSNGLLESVVSPTHLPSKVVHQRAEDGTISQKGGALPAGQSSEDVPAERRRRIEEHDHEEPARRSATGLEQDVEDAHAAREELAVCQAAQVSSSAPTAARLSEAERPEPEGEVAVLTEDKMAACALKTEEGEPLQTPASAQEFNQPPLTSTPTLAVTSALQEPAVRPPSSEDVQLCSEEEEEEQKLELLASGLITEVISAARQEVLSCSLTDSGHPNCSSTPLGASWPCPQQEPITAKQLRLPLNGCQEAEPEDSGMPNGCSPLEHGGRQANGVQTDQRTAAQTHDRKLAAEEASALAEDSACSTCHSEDGVGGEDLQNSGPTGRSDAASTQAASTEAAPSGEDNAVDELKRLNGLSLRNGGVGNEAETDQSGGETAAAAASWFLLTVS